MRRFAYRLALRLGQANVNRMLRGMTIRDLGEWRQYADLEPFDETRADLRAASIVQALLNVHRGKGKAAIKLEDCVLQFGTPPKKSPEEARTAAREQVKATMAMMMKIQNAPRKKRGKA